GDGCQSADLRIGGHGGRRCRGVLSGAERFIARRTRARISERAGNFPVRRLDGAARGRGGAQGCGAVLGSGRRAPASPLITAGLDQTEETFAGGGNQSVKTVSPSDVRPALTVPPCSCMMVFTIANPSPAPSVDFSLDCSMR